MAALLLYILVLIAGGSVLSIEILGARMLEPFCGLGPFLWSVLLAVTLMALVLGFAIGGRQADRDARNAALAIPLIASGCWMLLVPWIRKPVLLFLEPQGLRLDVVVAAALLIGPPVVLLGIVLPLAVRLKVSGMVDIGRAVGRVCGVFAVGGVAFALFAWFVLIPTLGVFRTALLTGLVQIIGGAAAFRSRERVRTVARAGAALAVIGVLFLWKAGTGAAGQA